MNERTDRSHSSARLKTKGSILHGTHDVLRSIKSLYFCATIGEANLSWDVRMRRKEKKFKSCGVRKIYFCI